MIDKYKPMASLGGKKDVNFNLKIKLIFISHR